ncbi:hypothetical protein [Mycolicibacter algericus]|uniref:Uncharacterized protein n=1 Tax=Mycolicibacter algericus DSM 45454 TaxID=723879 RepID=A0ABX3RM92_MYCAL|nr:hypothetical protein [Mycolicibacter algericus]OQZ95246.1 hypothetical protein BST10_15970 [Mycolicibacter algericus DSM 45454]
MSKRLVAVSGVLLAAATFAGTGLAYADEPTLAAEQQVAEQQAAAEQQQQVAEQHAEQATTAGATTAGAGGMGASIGSSMAMMGPMMAMYAPMMLAPMLMSGVTSLVGGAPATGAEAASAAATDFAGSAAATDAWGLAAPIASDLANLDLTLDPDLLAGAATDVGTDLVTGLPLDVPFDASVPDIDPSLVLDSLGDAVVPGLADAGVNIGSEVAGTGVCVGLALIGLC